MSNNDFMCKYNVKPNRKPTNRQMIIGLLKDPDCFGEDEGASYEAMVYYNINCPYFEGDKRALCHGDTLAGCNRDQCVECKEKWLNSEVDE